jgi:cytochrome c-type biogenesis protein CcmH
MFAANFLILNNKLIFFNWGKMGNALNLKVLLILMAFGVGWGCDRGLKEHPLPPEMKRQMELKADPKVKANEVAGKVEFGPEITGDQAKVAEGAMLFIFARARGVAGGPPLAVKRLSGVKFPYEFALSQLDVMLETVMFAGEMTLSARLDGDGNAKASPGDIEGSVDVKAGDKNVVLRLNHVVPQPPPGGETVTGTVTISPTQAREVPTGAVLFLFARQKGTEGGPPLAVTLEKQVKFPYAFQLGQQNVMIPDGKFEGEMDLFARLDLDGNADTRQGDLQGRVAVKAGARNVALVLDRVIGE